MNEMLHNVNGVFSRDLGKIPPKVKRFRLDLNVEKWESLRQPNGYRRQRSKGKSNETVHKLLPWHSLLDI